VRIIYHITDRQAWDLALASGEYRHPSLTSEGFIHCSLAGQVAATAKRHFKGQRDLVLLEIAEEKVRAKVVHENTSGGTELFPHIYGPLNCDAVTAVQPFDNPA
jgi:uncharacterized protein (DUF952 family)